MVDRDNSSRNDSQNRDSLNSLPTSNVHNLPRIMHVGHSNRIDVGYEDIGIGLDLKQYIQIIFKYRVVIGACFLACTLLSLVYAFLATPLYTAESKIRISTYEPVLSATRIEDMLQEKSKEANYLETQIQEMKSFSLADRVLENTSIKNYFTSKSGGLFSFLKSKDEPEVSSDKGMYTHSIDVLRNYLSTVEIKPVRRTSLVSVVATAKDPSIAAQIANLHAENYMDWVRSSRVEQQARGLSFLRIQADELRQKVADLEREAADYAEANAIVAVNKDENITAQKMSQLNKLLTDASAARIQAENQYKEAEVALANPSAGFDDSSTQQMRSELARIQAEYDQLSAKFQPGYPKMGQLKAQIEGIKESIQGQRKQIVSGLRAKMLAATAEEKNLREELERQKSQAFELSKRQVQYNILNREISTSRDLLENVLKQTKETSLAVESNASNVSIVDQAVVPFSPSYPRKSLVVLLGLVAGSGLGLLLALLLNYMDSTIRTPDDIAQYLRAPNLGVVPSFDIEGVGGVSARKSRGILPGSASADTKSGGSDKTAEGKELITNPEMAVVFVQDPRSLAAEAYRTIRTGILLSQAGEPPKTILVTSAQPSEGKTTSSINLAVSLAGNGSRVILIDSDLRRPSLYKGLGLDGKAPGLTDLLTGQTTLEQVAQHDVVKRLTIITAGTIPPNPAELLGSKEMFNLVRSLETVYDFVIIDSPPILAVTDSLVLSRYVDGVVMVVRGATTPRRVVQDAKSRLTNVGAKLLGVILNDVDIRGGDYYYYNKYYYSYYTRDEKSAASS
jgi:succinoglycan biosynthesis transport protein ExoP